MGEKKGSSEESKTWDHGCRIFKREKNKNKNKQHFWRWLWFLKQRKHPGLCWWAKEFCPSVPPEVVCPSLPPEVVLPAPMPPEVTSWWIRPVSDFWPPKPQQSKVGCFWWSLWEFYIHCRIGIQVQAGFTLAMELRAHPVSPAQCWYTDMFHHTQFEYGTPPSESRVFN